MHHAGQEKAKGALKIFLILLIVIGLTLIGSIASIYKSQYNSTITEIKQRERNSLSLRATAIQREFEAIAGDLLFLMYQNELHDYLETGNEEAIQDVMVEYLALASVKRIYDQIRFLDSSGTEKARVNFSPEFLSITEQGDLQKKKHRYYYENAFNLDKNQIYISPMDLNIEHGQVEVPFKPVIRFAGPVFDSRGEKRGVLVLNYLAGRMLKIIGKKSDDAIGDRMLVNAQGYWLLHPNPDMEWGFMIGDRAKMIFSNYYPDAWVLMQKQKSGQAVTENGLFTFILIQPLNEGFSEDIGLDKLYTHDNENNSEPQYSWMLISYVSPKILAGYGTPLITRLLLIGIGLFVIFSLGALQLAFAISKRRFYQKRLVKMALNDDLTGLPNRKYFFQKLDEGLSHAIRHERNLGVLFIDLDGFKNVNDTLGHKAGDELLIQVGDKLKKSIRKADTVARLGGDEFAVLLLEIKTPENALQVGTKIVNAMKQTFTLSTGEANIGACVGAAVFPDHGDTADILVNAADEAMYQAKSTGKGACNLAS